ncbi:PepSY-associated TM helix domain-containing protein [Mycolicibacterium arenosum]|uniref:PepSY domain-containing protein n=1 Tax=Mycolicibacterium arenosum TaxID=2952157 RepID=A0ABT1LYE2_9MYCO|nr:PepSY-associated TM helix domain-containing protein [Mycolicibacterium sp. CAU 1645]MCP9271064.1 PepSY domain-containing protein [Mycolicibacterium sp. CAU 1645]
MSSSSPSLSTPDDPALASSMPAQRGPLPLLRRLHFYAGVLVAPFILIAAVTGALYAVAPTVERFVYGDILSVTPAGDALPLTAQAEAAGAAVPDLQMSGVRPAADPHAATRVMFTDPDLGEEFARAVFVDPYSGRVLGQEPTWFGYLPVSTWLDGLHRHLQLGEPGRVYSELAASWLWVVALGGAVLWWARRRRSRLLLPDRSTTGRLRTLNWHAVVGLWILPMLLFLSATGITWSTYAGEWVSDLRAHFAWERPQLDTAAVGGHDDHGASSGHRGDGPVDLDAVVRAANGVGVDAPLELTLPATPGDSVGVTEIDEPYRLTTDAAAVDPATLQVTSVVDYARDYSTIAKLADWGIRMHMGFLFGWLNQLLLFGIAVALVTVIVRGYRMWWQRRPTRGTQWAVGRPPVRGFLRRQHPAVLGALTVGAVAVGVVLPLLGISLAAFLVLDAIVGRVRAG